MEVKKLLGQNSKLKKDGIYQFDLPAYKSKTGMITCPNAKTCIANCYARQGTYVFSNVQAKYEYNLEISLRDDFVEIMDKEIKATKKLHTLRLHSSGDIYSREYFQKWLKIASLNPNIQFYAYTKSFDLVQWSMLPSNFKIIQSEGGVLPIDKSKPHAIVYKDETIIPKDYSNASESDMIAVKNNNIALVWHGTKKPVYNGFIQQ
jgi:hypothetical protein